MAKKITGFNFWKENKLDQHFTLTDEELKTKFSAWLKTKEQDWIEYYNTARLIRFFITSQEGLNSVCDELEMNEMYDTLLPIVLERVK